MTILTPEQCQEQFKELTPAEQNVLIAFAIECHRAEEKHPNTNWPISDQRNGRGRGEQYNDYVYGAAIVCEEAGELIRAASQYQYENGRPNEMITEAKQTGATALRFIKNLPKFD
jgi:hypothetical protein